MYTSVSQEINLTLWQFQYCFLQSKSFFFVGVEMKVENQFPSLRAFPRFLLRGRRGSTGSAAPTVWRTRSAWMSYAIPDRSISFSSIDLSFKSTLFPPLLILKYQFRDSLNVATNLPSWRKPLSLIDPYAAQTLSWTLSGTHQMAEVCHWNRTWIQ